MEYPIPGLGEGAGTYCATCGSYHPSTTAATCPPHTTTIRVTGRERESDDVRAAFSGIFDRLARVAPETRAHLFYLLEHDWCWSCGRIYEAFGRDEPVCACALARPAGESEPVAWRLTAKQGDYELRVLFERKAEAESWATENDVDGCSITPLYTSPPAPVVRDEAWKERYIELRSRYANRRGNLASAGTTADYNAALADFEIARAALDAHVLGEEG